MDVIDDLEVFKKDYPSFAAVNRAASGKLIFWLRNYVIGHKSILFVMN